MRTHQKLAPWLRPGMTLAQIDTFVARTLEELSCRSCFLGYRAGKSPPFPSHACLSVNDCVVHGTAGSYTAPLQPGDVLKIDIGVTHRGWIGDAAWTYSFGPPTPRVRALMECGKEALRRGCRALTPGNTFLAWAQAVHPYVEQECGFHLVRGLGGHGIGRTLHAPPFVSNTLPTYLGEWPDAAALCEPGILVAVEPMIALTTGQTRGGRTDWPILTQDGCVAVHYEHDVLIAENGPDVLTRELEALPDELPA